MAITLHFAEKSGTKDLAHDLHFQAAKYELTHVVVCRIYALTTDKKQEFPKPTPGLLKLLAESGETPGYTVPTSTPPLPAPVPVAAAALPAAEDSKKRKLETSEDRRQTKKSSASSTKGKEWTVRIVTEHKTPEMYVKNDLEGLPAPFFGYELIGRGRV